MKIILERHAYAPELNKAFIGPAHVCVPAPGCKSIKDVRQKLFSPLKYRGRHVVIQSHYPTPYEWVNQTRNGFCNDLRSLSGALRIFRQKLDMRQSPTVSVKTQLVG